ncbi:MAG: Wzz/FepE/Etk N-terminal domain-containing protein [Solibacillus sp.]|uniref:YveK family protein n=1 Tax=Solibacillus sp. TaxID=1909654 RepID=UPI00331622AE
MEETISLSKIVEIIRKRIVLIIIFIIISISISIGVTFYVLTPIYQAQTQILVNQKSNSVETNSWQATDIDLRLINTYNEIITSPVILTPVIEKLELDTTPEQLMEQITVSSKSDSQVVNISVIVPDPLNAVEIANTVAEVFKEQIPKLMSVDNITILSAAKQSDSPRPLKPNKELNLVVGAVIGFMLGVGLAMYLEFLDTTIKSEDDIETFLHLPVMGVVGLIPEEKVKKKSLFSQKDRRKKNVLAEK